MKTRKYWLLGIIGGLCFGAGDWLLEYVDPASVGEEFHVIHMGHGANYDLTKVSVTLLLAALGMVFLLPGFRAMANIVKDEKKKAREQFLWSLCAVGWIMIHFTVSVGIYVYSWCMHLENVELAHDLAVDVMDLFQPMQLVCYVFVAAPLILQLIDILRGKTVCKKMAALFSPLVWMCIFSAMAKILPAGPLANGLDGFCMNFGMIVWFVYLCMTNPVCHEKIEAVQQ